MLTEAFGTLLALLTDVGLDRDGRRGGGAGLRFPRSEKGRVLSPLLLEALLSGPLLGFPSLTSLLTGPDVGLDGDTVVPRLSV